MGLTKLSINGRVDKESMIYLVEYYSLMDMNPSNLC